MFNKLHGKELSYNNLLDVDAANFKWIQTDDPTFAILKTITLVVLLQEKR
jgi:phosphoribosylaminoimidazolecarboxamide formyltransferase/IMP cyclohydrolase